MCNGQIREDTSKAHSQPSHRSRHLIPAKADTDKRGKRIFERRSGSPATGVKSLGKRDGKGKYNWGDFDDIVDAGMDEVEGFNQDRYDEQGSVGDQKQE